MDRKIVDRALRASLPLHEAWCLPQYSFLDAVLSLKAISRDQYVFLLGLATKIPLLSGLNAAVNDQLLGSQTTRLSPDKGAPLLLCFIQDWVSVSFPSNPDWTESELTISYSDLAPSGDIREAQGVIDNLSCYKHAAEISVRHQVKATSNLTLTQQWEQRSTVFPHLLFGLHVGDDAKMSGHLSVILSKLQALNNSASAWKRTGGTIPIWALDVTRESEGTRNDPKLSAARIFRSHDGSSKLFEWHAKFGSWRIHMNVDASSRTVEVGYIGQHLPLG